MQQKNPSLGLLHESNAHKQEGCCLQPPRSLGRGFGRGLQSEMDFKTGPK